MVKPGASKNVVIPVESAEAVKQNLRQVSEEIARVRDRAREEADSLERIRGMLDLKYLNELLSVIEQLETRVKQVEAGTAAQKYQNELKIEQTRLAKLWDAFKTQEDQLRALQRERDDILGQYKNIEKQMADIGTPNQVRNKMSKLESDKRQLEADLTSGSNRLEQYVTLFTQEQERLAKLYKVYEDTEARLGRVEAENKAWRTWWEKHSGAVGKDAAAAAKRIRRAK